MPILKIAELFVCQEKEKEHLWDTVYIKYI